MTGPHSRRVRGIAFGFALGMATILAAATPAVAQDAEVEFDENETEGTIDRVRLQLLGIAAITGGLLVAYIWHTDPQRRQRVAVRRRDDRERAALDALDDEFLLPVDVEDDESDVDGPAGRPDPGG